MSAKPTLPERIQETVGLPIRRGFSGSNLGTQLYQEELTKTTNALLALYREYAGEIIGENEPEFSTPKPDLPVMSRNRMREEQRQKLEEQVK